MTKNKLIFTIGDKVIKFTVRDFDKNVDIDKLLKIDYGNLLAELITFPVVVNRLGILAAEMDNQVSEAKLNFTITEAKLQEKIRKKLTFQDEKGKIKKPTIAEVEDALIQNKIWISKKKELLRVIRDKEFMYSVYNSAKDKSKKLDKLSLTLKVGDVDEQIIQKQLNNVYFKIKDGFINNQ
jgi:hypothetical protein